MYAYWWAYSYMVGHQDTQHFIFGAPIQNRQVTSHRVIRDKDTGNYQFMPPVTYQFRQPHDCKSK